ncbi:GFA family protein [Notoacmeibacter sp. MSK16QG-6]|uniref:GFA family protein n=1 Tax=Notoacmeibacter sp. MSK16QG-6 TaxID=2957982 RepID=UPI00209D739A|nr:GFA family protein [Notoacmeibacter sp. MSK16QG-6]MCP1198975.1 GFA family protein [Notoacmeibacter sp. MSK16QG-6]
MTSVANGRCRCGAVRFELTAKPHFASYCHCEDCRRATGAPVVAFIGIYDNEIEWQGKVDGEYGEPPVTRFFCSSCGSPIGYRDDRLAGRIYLYTAALDEPSRFAPTVHAFWPEKLSWLMLEDDLPRNKTTSVRR